MEWYDYMNPLHTTNQNISVVCVRNHYKIMKDIAVMTVLKPICDSVFHSYIIAYWQTTGSAPLTPTI